MRNLSEEFRKESTEELMRDSSKELMRDLSKEFEWVLYQKELLGSAAEIIIVKSKSRKLKEVKRKAPVPSFII